MKINKGYLLGAIIGGTIVGFIVPMVVFSKDKPATTNERVVMSAIGIVGGLAITRVILS